MYSCLFGRKLPTFGSPVEVTSPNADEGREDADDALKNESPLLSDAGVSTKGDIGAIC